GCLVLRNEPFADLNLVIILRIIISLAVSVLGATIPGFLQIGWNLKGMTLRAGGAMALFCLTYLVSPTVVQAPPQAPPENRKTSLLLRMKTEGIRFLPRDSRQRGALFEFSLSNATYGLAEIDDMVVDVLDVIEDKWLLPEDKISTYKYRVTLD